MGYTRREFIMKTAAGVATGLAARRGGAQSANDRLGVALIGCGGRGASLFEEAAKQRESYNLEFPAICDVWRVNLEKMAARIEKETGKKPKTFTRYADLLEQPEVDAVFIATPDFAHCPILADAARAKKHAYVEKPMATRMKDANKALDAVLENGIICQVGTQRRSEGRYRAAANLIQSGILGTLVKCECGWHDKGPRWLRGYDDVKKADVDWDQFLMYLPKEPFDARKFRCWHLYRDCSVGLVGLLGSHFIDLAVWFTQDPLPRTAVGMGAHIVWTDRENYDSQECLFHYPKGHMVQYSSRLGNAARPYARGADEAYNIVFYGTKATWEDGTWTISGEGGGEGGLEQPVVVEREPSVSHVGNWFQCIRDNNPHTNADVYAGYAHSVASIMGTVACEQGRRVTFDLKHRIIKKG